jgi:hypothetical protein
MDGTKTQKHVGNRVGNAISDLKKKTAVFHLTS